MACLAQAVQLGQAQPSLGAQTLGTELHQLVYEYKHNMNEKPIQNQHIRVFLHLILGRIMWDWIGVNDLLHATLLDKCAIIMIWDHLLLLQVILDF